MFIVPPGSDELYEAQIPYKPVASNLVRVETQLGKGTQTFGIADGETGTEVDLLAFNDKHGIYRLSSPQSQMMLD